MEGWNPLGNYYKYRLRVVFWHNAWMTEDYPPVKEHYGRLMALSAQQCAKWARETWPDLKVEG